MYCHVSSRTPRRRGGVVNDPTIDFVTPQRVTVGWLKTQQSLRPSSPSVFACKAQSSVHRTNSSGSVLRHRYISPGPTSLSFQTKQRPNMADATPTEPKAAASNPTVAEGAAGEDAGPSKKALKKAEKKAEKEAEKARRAAERKAADQAKHAAAAAEDWPRTITGSTTTRLRWRPTK
jgi:hypothetical protein